MTQPPKQTTKHCPRYVHCLLQAHLGDWMFDHWLTGQGDTLPPGMAAFAASAIQ